MIKACIFDLDGTIADTPVSYTHLDVYKRQGQWSPGCSSRGEGFCSNHVGPSGI